MFVGHIVLVTSLIELSGLCFSALFYFYVMSSNVFYFLFFIFFLHYFLAFVC